MAVSFYVAASSKANLVKIYKFVTFCIDTTRVKPVNATVCTPRTIFSPVRKQFLVKEVAAAGIEPTNPKFRSPPQPSGLLTDHQSLIALSSSAWCQLLIQLC